MRRASKWFWPGASNARSNGQQSSRLRRIWKRYWPVAVLAVASLAVMGYSILVDWQTQEPPNYTRIEDGLYIGGYVPEPPPGTRAVLNLCEFDDPYPVEQYRWQKIPDAPPAPSIDWLRQQVDFIDEQRCAGRPVFVHCYAGVSRSATVTAAYLMRRNGWSRDRALQFVQSRREVVRPIPAFMQLLFEWEIVVRRPLAAGDHGG